MKNICKKSIKNLAFVDLSREQVEQRRKNLSTILNIATTAATIGAGYLAYHFHNNIYSWCASPLGSNAFEIFEYASPEYHSSELVFSRMQSLILGGLLGMVGTAILGTKFIKDYTDKKYEHIRLNSIRQR